MLSTLTSILIFLIILGVLVFIHELGHYLVARAVGAKVEEFALGLGLKVWSKKIGETVYRLNLFPIGGYVKILGESDDAKSDDVRSLKNKTPIQKILVMIAGITMNFLLASLIYFVIFFTTGFKFYLPDNYADFKPYVGDLTIEKLDNEIKYGSLVDGLGAQKAGLPSEGTIKSINGKAFTYSNEIPKVVKENAGKEIVMNVCNVKCNDYTVKVNDEGRVGISVTPNYVNMLSYEKIKPVAGFGHAANMLKLMLGTLSDIFARAQSTGDYSEVANTVSGPVGIYLAIDTVKSYGFISVIGLAADLSLVLAFMNLLPIPALDGGRIVLTLPELITGKPLNPKFEIILINVSFIILLTLMALIFVKDIVYFDALKEMLK